MFRRTLAIIGLLLLSIPSIACDVCGCSINAYGAGLLSTYRYNTISLGWHDSPFQQLLNQGIPTKDNFRSLELSVRYHLSQRWVITLQQPYQWNHRLGPDKSVNLNGFGDTRLMGTYVFADNIPVGASSQLYWEAGMGTKLPSGRFNDNIYLDDLPDNFNIGNGSWAYLFQSSIMFHFDKLGMVLNSAYQANTKNIDDYHFGNQWSMNAVLFARHQLSEKAEIIPFSGLLYENIKADQRYNDNDVHGTGGKGYFLSLGANFKYGNYLLGTSCLVPLSQTYAQGEMKAKTRYSLELTYSF